METESDKAGVHIPPPYPTNENAMPGGTTPYPPAVPQIGYPGQPQNPYPAQNPYPLPSGPVGYYPPTTPVQTANVGQVPYGGGQQQHQPIVVINQPVTQPVQNFCGLIVLSCFVFWCCGWVCGLIAFILAMVAQDRASSDPQTARQLGRASLGVSITGIVNGIVIIIIIIAVLVSASSSCRYTYNGICYKYRSSSYSRYRCPGVYTGYYCYYD